MNIDTLTLAHLAATISPEEGLRHVVADEFCLFGFRDEPQHRRVVQVLDRKQWQEHEPQGQLRPEVSRLRKET